MSTRHVIQPGECLQSLAATFGLRDAQTLFVAPENEKLRQLRKTPLDVGPGDTVVVPDTKPKERTLGTGKTHAVTVSSRKTKIRVAVCDDQGHPLAGKPYTLHLEGDSPREGTTTGAGLVEQPLGIEVQDALLVVHDKDAKDAGRWVWKLKIAHLAPAAAETGARQRLINLGYGCPEDPRAPHAAAALALAARAFQHDEGLEESGKLDQPTLDRLAQRHDT